MNAVLEGGEGFLERISSSSLEANLIDYTREGKRGEGSTFTAFPSLVRGRKPHGIPSKSKKTIY